MALSLTEAAKLSQDQMKRGVIETIIERSPLLQQLPFLQVTGNAYSYVREKTLGGAAFRTVNNGYAESTGTFSKHSVALSILGGDADVDRFIVQTNGGEVADARAAAVAMKAKAVRLTFHDAFINGTGTSGEFEGLNAILSDAEASSQVVLCGDEGMPIVGSDSDDRQSFFDKLDELISKVDGGPSMLLMNGEVLAKFQQAARRESAYAETRDAFGKAVTTYRGVPLVDVGVNAAGSPIIGVDEEYGDDNGSPATDKASSIYAVRFDVADGVAGLTNGGVQVYDLGELESKPVLRTRIEFYCAVAVHKLTSVAVLRGVLSE